jgi:hypothetical protein
MLLGEKGKWFVAVVGKPKKKSFVLKFTGE